MIFGIILLTACVNLLLGILSYKKDPKSITNRLLTALTVIFALWTIANYFSLHARTTTETLFWIRSVMFITAPMGPILYLFAKAFPSRTLKINKGLLLVLFSLTALAMGIAYTPFVFSGVTFTNGITPIPQLGVVLHGFLLIGSTIAAILEIIKKYKKATGSEQHQLRYLIFGISSTFSLLILTNFVFVILLKLTNFVIFGPIFSLIFVAFIFYAIVKHRLMQIRLVLARSVGYTIMIGIFAVIYTLGVFIINRYIFQSSFSIQQQFASIILALFVVVSFERIKSSVEKATDRIFFRGKYNSAELILDLTLFVASTYAFKKLTETSLKKIVTSLRVQRGFFLILKRNNHMHLIDEGYRKKPLFPKEIVDKIFERQKTILLDEEKDPQIRQKLIKVDCAIVIPLIEQDQRVGLLALGHKRSGEIYTEQDVKLLEIFGPIITLAIQNAKSYDEIKRFNRTLNEKVQNATKELQASHEKLKTLDKQKDAFLGMASHELKTPITSIKAFTQVLIKRAEKEKQTKYEYILKNINTQTDRITQLINDLLNVSHIESGKLVLKKTTFDLGQLITKIITDIQVTTDTHEIVKKGITSIAITGDENRIEQVMSNLLTNAIKYSPNADKIIVSIEKNVKEVTVNVQDFGQGIPLADQKKIFERFYRTQEHEDRNISGFGLGLFIASEIIKRHKGKIWVTSTKGKGATFSFTLPLTKLT